MRDGRRKRLGLQEGTEGTVGDTYLDRILTDEEAAANPYTIAADTDVNFDTRDFRNISDTYNYYYGGGFDTAQDDATPPSSGDGGSSDGGTGGGTTPTTGDTTPGTNTPEQQRLIDEGIGLQIEPGSPVFAPGEMPVTQEEIDEFNQIPVNQNYATPDLELENQYEDPDRFTLGSGKPPDLELENQYEDPDRFSETYFDGTATLKDAGGTYDGMQSAEGGFGEEVNYTPKQESTVQNIFGKVGDNVSLALTELGKLPGAIVDTLNQTVDVFGKKIDVGKTIGGLIINKIAGGPATFAIEFLKNVLPEQDPRVKKLNDFYSTGEGAEYTDPSSPDYIPGLDQYNTVSGGFLNMVTGGKYGTPTNYGLQGTYQKSIDRIEKTLANKYNMTDAEIADAKAGKYKGDVTSDLIKRIELYGDAKKKEADMLGITAAEDKRLKELEFKDFFAGDVDERDQMLEDISLQNKIDAGIQAADDDSGSEMLDTTPKESTFASDYFDDYSTAVQQVFKNRKEEPTNIEPSGTILEDDFESLVDTPSDQDIIDRGGGDDIGTGGLDPDRGQQVDRGSSGAGDNQPVSTTTGPPSTGFQPQSTYDAELEDDRDVGGGGNEGNNSNSKIVCTMMNESYGFGSFRNKIWMKFHKDLSPEYQKGYHKLFLPLIKIAKTNKVVKKVLEHIAVHSTIDMRQATRGKTHLLGRVYRKILLPLCYWVGKNAKR